MKIFYIVLAFVSGLWSCASQSKNKQVENNSMPQTNTVHSFKVEGLNGDTIDFSHFKGKKIIIVNTASKCGLTPQYEALENLYKKYNHKLVIVGFPANDFMNQEPGTNEEIATFCNKNYGVSFPMASKISVKGSEKAQIFKWLTNKDYNGVESGNVLWNFQKFLLDEDGKLVKIIQPQVKPDSKEIIDWIEQ